MAKTINTMVEQLSRFAEEVTRVAREVGTSGQLGGQANVEGVTGIWRELTTNVNLMATNLTNQVRNIAEVTTAVAQGDLTRKVTIEAQGELQNLKNTINLMVSQLMTFAGEITRVARKVGTEGKLGGQAVEGVSGTWRELTTNVNLMATNLTDQVRNLAEVTTAVSQGDLTRKITVNAQGEILALKNTVNNMVDQLNQFATEMIRVAREVGREGKLGVQANVQGVSGSWSILTDNLNEMAGNLTEQVRNIAEVTTAVAQGDFSRKITIEARGEVMDLKNTINTMVEQLNRFAAEVTRVAREVGTEGKLGGQASVEKVGGTWRELTNNVNEMARNLTEQVRNIAEVTIAITQGDFTRKITVDAKGEIQDLKTTINTMVDQLNRFVDEVSRVAREVGTDGKLGGQAEVRGVAGTWRELTDNVNEMARNLTEQVRSIANVVVSIAQGNLKKRLTLTARGEIASLATTINDMIDTLTIFAEQTLNVARDVGVEGKLGGQAKVPGATGTWRELTDNVNQLATNLTTQVRAIGEVATAVTQGDLSRTISVDSQGELTVLKDNINTMIANLRETTRINSEQDWLKTNLTRFTRMMQGQRDVNSMLKTLFSELAPAISAQHGVCYLLETENGTPFLKLATTYAYNERKRLGSRFALGESLVGQCALERQRILLTEVPADYIQISSGLGKGTPLNLILLPVQFEDSLLAIIELASFNRFSEIHINFLDQLSDSMGVMLNAINSIIRTEKLLEESQSMGKELQSQQRELEQSNQEMEQKQQQLELTNAEMERQKRELEQSNRKMEEQTQELEGQNVEVERKNKEVELARIDLEKKANELELTSKYKSQFLTNMSHELRTPLNSLLVLAKLLSNNDEGNLTEKQIEYVQIIHASGKDLLNLINDILDISKIEAGVTAIDSSWLEFEQLRQNLEGSFRQIAQQKGVGFDIKFEEQLPAKIYTDTNRLFQIMKNLLANAFKFTEQGQLVVNISRAIAITDLALKKADFVIAFAVSDTGIGIPESKQ